MWQHLAAGVLSAACGSYQAGSAVLDAGLGGAVGVALSEVPILRGTRRHRQRLSVAGLRLSGGPADMPQQNIDRLSGLVTAARK